MQLRRRRRTCSTVDVSSRSRVGLRPAAPPQAAPPTLILHIHSLLSATAMFQRQMLLVQRLYQAVAARRAARMTLCTKTRRQPVYSWCQSFDTEARKTRRPVHSR